MVNAREDKNKRTPVTRAMPPSSVIAITRAVSAQKILERVKKR